MKRFKNGWSQVGLYNICSNYLQNQIEENAVKLIEDIEGFREMYPIETIETPPRTPAAIRFIDVLQTTIFRSSSGRTEQWSKFARMFRHDMKKLLGELGATDIRISTGHFDMHGFFTARTGQIYYISLSDVRFSKLSPLLLRTVKSYEDYTGGSNGFIPLDDSFKDRLKAAIQKATPQ